MRWRCRACGCLYTPQAPCCPACRSTVHDTEEDEVAKIDRFSAVSVAGVTTVHASAILPDSAAVPPRVPAAEVKPAAAEEVPAVVTVADQKAAGVAPEDTVTVAEQKAGTPPPVAPEVAAKARASAVPPKRKGAS